MFTKTTERQATAKAIAESFTTVRPVVGVTAPAPAVAKPSQFNAGAWPRRIIPIRASSLSTLVSCPARWKAIHLDHLPTKTSQQAKIGTALHSGVAAFDKARMIGNTDRILENACEAFREELVRKEEGLVWDGKELDKAVSVGGELLKNYAEKIAPTKTYVAIEQKCPSLDLLVEGVVLRLTGTVDRVRKTDEGNLGISDFKSGESAVRADGSVPTAAHRAQLGVYEILGRYLMEQEMSAPAEIIGMQTNGKARVGVGIVHGATETLIGTDEAPGTLVYAAKLLKEGIFYGNPSDILCGEKFCPIFKSCRFRD